MVTKLIKDVLKTDTLRHSSITLVGTILTGILGLIFFILMARYLGPEKYGLFSVGVAILTLIASLGDVGTNTGIVNFVGRHIKKERSLALKYLKLGLEIKIAVWFLILSIGYSFAPFFAEALFNKPELALPIRYALIGFGGASLFSFSTHALQALQRFWVWTALSISLNGLRLFGLLLLAFLGYLTLPAGFILYIIFPFLGFAVGIFYLPRFLKVRNEFQVAKTFFHYNKWVATFTVISAVSSRLDTLISTRLLTISDVGIYSVAVNLSGIVPQIVFAMAVVVAPKLTQFDTKKKAVIYLKKLQAFVMGLSGLGLVVGVPIASYIIPKLYGQEYTASLTPFIILLIAQAIFLISVPAHTAVIYYFSYPKLFVYITSVNLLIISVLGWLLIGSYGYTGAALAVLIGNLTSFIIPGVWVLKKFRE